MKKNAISMALAVLLLSSGAVLAQDVLPDTMDTSTTPDTQGPSVQAPDTQAPNTGSNNGGLSPELQAALDQANSQEKPQELGGDEGLACQAILCLSSATRPGECAKSLARYFSINLSKPWKTIQARINFLKMCPTSSDTPQMNSLVEAIGNGAGRCDAATLNQVNRTWVGENEYEISNVMPSYCDAYFNHEYTDINSLKPHYVDRFVVRTYTDWEGNTITEYDGGYWVDGTTQLPSSVAATSGAIPAAKDSAGVGF